MTIEYIRYRIAEDRAADFEAAYARAAVALASSSHCIGYELARCVEAPESYILRIEWDSLDGHLQGFRSSPEFGDFFAEIRFYVDAIEEMQHYDATDVTGIGAATPQPPSLYEWAGGTDAFVALFEHFYRAVADDELLAPLFASMDPEHPRHVALWVAEVFGGPAVYTEHHGGYEVMLAHHLGKQITEEQRRRWVNRLVDAADAVGLPADPEFRSAFMAYVEWGSRLAVANSGADAEPVRHAPVPRWGWGVAPPWQG